MWDCRLRCFCLELGFKRFLFSAYSGGLLKRLFCGLVWMLRFEGVVI